MSSNLFVTVRDADGTPIEDTTVTVKKGSVIDSGPFYDFSQLSPSRQRLQAQELAALLETLN